MATTSPQTWSQNWGERCHLVLVTWLGVTADPGVTRGHMTSHTNELGQIDFLQHVRFLASLRPRRKHISQKEWACLLALIVIIITIHLPLSATDSLVARVHTQLYLSIESNRKICRLQLGRTSIRKTTNHETKKIPVSPSGWGTRKIETRVDGPCSVLGTWTLCRFRWRTGHRPTCRVWILFHYSPPGLRVVMPISCRTVQDAETSTLSCDKVSNLLPWRHPDRQVRRDS